MPFYVSCFINLGIRLNALTFTFLRTSRTHSFAYGLLILLQLPLHLLVLILKGKNTGSFPLTLTICGLTLHFRLFIEMQLNKFTLVKVDKNANPVKKHFFYESKRFIIPCHFLSLNNCECLK